MQISDSGLSLSAYSNSYVGDRNIAGLKLTTTSASSGMTNTGGSGSAAIIEISVEAQKAYYSSRQIELSGYSVITSTDGDSSQLQFIGTSESMASETWETSRELTSVTAVSAGRNLPAGWNVQFSSATFHYEAEQLRISISGSVTTQDGREISFAMDLGMSREYASIEQETISAGAVTTDPLIINFGGGLPGLSDARFAFDINSDGISELVSATATGSGFLALDGNGDGRINNGSELFGPSTGSGYSELSAYDGDLNGWIDENDEIFTRLSIWTRDENGNDRLLTLKEAGIGALSLDAVASPFSLTDDSNQLKGRVQSTGIFLTEEGKVGVMQQIDLAEQASGVSDSVESDKARQTAELAMRVSERLRNIGNLAATASWLADRSIELRQTFRNLKKTCRTHGGPPDSGSVKLDSVEQMMEHFRDSIKANSKSGERYKDSA